MFGSKKKDKEKIKNFFKKKCGKMIPEVELHSQVWEGTGINPHRIDTIIAEDMISVGRVGKKKFVFKTLGIKIIEKKDRIYFYRPCNLKSKRK